MSLVDWLAARIRCLLRGHDMAHEGRPSGGMDWITQLGIVTAAGQILNSGYEEAE